MSTANNFDAPITNFNYEDSIHIENPIKIVLESEEPEECVAQPCSIVNSYKCPDTKGYFSIENLFSELTSDYQRAIIRQNLGIGDAQSLVWGKIQGNLANQKDLYKFVQDKAKTDADKIIETINLQLDYWSHHIESKIESRASNITEFRIKPMYGTTMQLPVDVLLSWDYANEVERQKVNGYEIQPTTRNFLVQGITETKDITLSYYLDGLWLSRTITFTVYAPTFYGISSNFEECDSTVKDKFKVDAGEDEYIYILTAVPSEFSVNGLIGGFIDQGVTYVNERRYYVYKSVNSGLGATTITRHDSE